MWKVLILAAAAFYFVLPTQTNRHVYNGLIKNLNYIDKNYEKVNVDCVLGVVFANAFIKDLLNKKLNRRNVKLFDRTTEIINKSKKYFSKKPELNWIVENILNEDVWNKKLNFVNHNMLNTTDYNDYFATNLSTNFCLQNIIKNTNEKEETNCIMKINKKCKEKYIDDVTTGSGYILTHKLLIIQFLKARNCMIDEISYRNKTAKLCSKIFQEIVTADNFGKLAEIFDLFLEQTVLCGYEGYLDFLRPKWLLFILRSQDSSGCFQANPKTYRRYKRDANYLENGCVDHTTGLGASALALYYNYLENV